MPRPPSYRPPTRLGLRRINYLYSYRSRYGAGSGPVPRAPDRSLNRPSTITVNSLCKSASERLKLAEKRTEAVERERWETILEVDCKLQDASRALKQAQSRLAANEDRLTALEFRARAAEIEAREAKRALALIAEAIRKRLLCANPEAASRSA
jgi:hypothetical protein